MTEEQIKERAAITGESTEDILSKVTTVKMTADRVTTNVKIVAEVPMRVEHLQEEPGGSELLNYFSGKFKMTDNNGNYLGGGMGYVPLMTMRMLKHEIHGAVFEDRDADSKKSLDLQKEPGVEGVTMRLMEKAEDGTWKQVTEADGTPVTAVTGKDGAYSFERWKHSEYRVETEVPGGMYLSTASGDGKNPGLSQFVYEGTGREPVREAYAACTFAAGAPVIGHLNCGLIAERRLEPGTEILVIEGKTRAMPYTMVRPEYLKDYPDLLNMAVEAVSGEPAVFTLDQDAKTITGVSAGSGKIRVTIDQPREVSDYTGNPTASEEVSVVVKKLEDVDPLAIVHVPASVTLSDSGSNLDQEKHAGQKVTVSMEGVTEGVTARIQIDEEFRLTDKTGADPNGLTVRSYDTAGALLTSGPDEPGKVTAARLSGGIDEVTGEFFLNTKRSYFEGAKYEGTAKWYITVN